ncbi:ATP-binding cassette domain-containing protein [Chondrinema litorale]|uniref:ATP-binding cassette domain-containing protein n=1 Tax=Chondrinema litorale TaxID=2994555 RepID=UPI002543890A|nr:ATP-binding cassette domain-containing protein [Chondrinema litorale]UZR94766.1 ATP-binding cassette domain-containing protein [Chondrinema litorale]
MNERVLEVIIKLLAIIANIDDSAGDKRGIIEKFLNSHVSSFEVRKSLFLFDEYKAFAHDAGLKEAYDVASGLNKEVSMKQKIIILVHLIELVLADQEITDTEEGFILTVCKALNINTSLYNDIMVFQRINDATEMKSDNILLVNNREDASVYNVKHLQHHELDSTLAILRIPNLEMYFLRLMLPTNDLFMNGDQLNWEYVYPLPVGTSIRGQHIEPIYYSEIVSNFLREDAQEKIAFEAKDIRYYFPNGGKGLHNINIAEESGKLVALMGASGSGKSTLLNVLNGNLAPQTGSVTINGIDIYRYKEEIKGVLGYIPQDDLLIEELTVYENLFYAARLCFGKESDEALDKRVNDTLRSLGLYEARDLRVGNALDKTISGGQRKRLNIGLELLRQPAILFIDEPTSGLSSRDSENIIDLLRELTLKGKLIFVVIHQPSSDIFKMFDKLVLLDVGGYEIYYGNPLESLVYFRTLVNHIDREEESACPECGNVNVEEIFKIIENRVVDEYGNDTDHRKITPQSWYEKFLKNIRIPKLEKVLSMPPQNLDIPPRWKQILTFISRDMLAKLHNRQYMFINLLEAPLLAFILAFIVRFYHIDELTGAGGYSFSENKNIPAYIFMSAIVALFMGMTISAEEIIKDAKILKREKFLELSRASYLISKVIILFFFSAIQTLTYVLVGNWILEIEGMTLIYWSVLFACSCFANLLGLNISATFNSVITIYILIPLLLIPQLVLGGIVVKFDEINPVLANRKGYVPLIAEFITTRWAFEALMVSQFKDNNFEKDFYKYDKIKAEADYKRIYYLPALFTNLQSANRLKDSYGESKQIEKELLLLRNEIEKEQINTPEIEFESLDKLVTGRFNSNVNSETEDYLERLKSFYNDLYKQASKAKDKIIAERVATEEGEIAYKESIKMFHNESVTQVVTNVQSETRIIEYNGHLIQKIYPIYHNPPPGNYEIAFNAHFYAPHKYFMGDLISSLYFNLFVIWSMTFILYAALYFEIFKKLIQGFGISSLYKPRIR